MTKRTKVVVGAVVAVVLLGGVGLWYALLRDDAPPPADLSSLDDELAADDTDADQTGTAESEPRTGLDGVWQVVPADDAFAGYRIEELYGPGATLKTTVTGRTDQVTGSFEVSGTVITAVELEVDTASLESDRSRRDETLRLRGLETDTYPTATFVLTEPLDLDSLPAEGEEIDVTANGELTMHGETQPVEVALAAKWSGDSASVEGSIEIILADYDIEAISIPQFVGVDDHGTLEFVLLFERQPAPAG